MSKWRQLQADEARVSKLYGFGGWLVALYCWAIFLTVWQLFGGLNAGEGLAKMYGSAEGAAIMRVVLIIKALSWLPFLVLAPLRHKLMPAVTLVCVLGTFLLDAVIVNAYLGLPMMKYIGVNVFNGLIAFGYSAYLLYSKRVNITYRQRQKL